MLKKMRKDYIQLKPMRVPAFMLLLMFFLIAPNIQWVAAETLVESFYASYFTREGSYGAYLSALSDLRYAQAEIFITGESFVSAEPDVLPAVPPHLKDGIISPEEGFVTWEFTVTLNGLYNIEIAYVNLPGRGASVERTILINGELPYRELSFIRFPRLWKNEWLFGKYDINGNSVRPSYSEIEEFSAVFVRDTAGYFTRPLAVYLEEGTHTITLCSEREPMFVQYIRFATAPSIPAYTEYYNELLKKGYSSAKSELALDRRTMQAEDHMARSDRANIPVASRDSKATEPQDAFRVLINSISGGRWRTQDSALYWDFTPDATGLYMITLRGRQSVYRGVFSTRTLTIDGEIPFREAGNLQFLYSTDWQIITLGNEEHGSFQFLFEKGKTYRIGLRVELGEMGEIIRRVEESVFKLNGIFRTILMITGPSPDRGRDYGFRRLIPDVLADMKVQAEVLHSISDDIMALAGARTDRTVQIDRLVYLLERMYTRPSDIADVFNNFRSSISATGSWLLESAYQPLDLDWIAITTVHDKLPRASQNFFSELWFSVQTFIASFVIDWTRVGSTVNEKSEQQITVWLSTGRDQSQIIRQSIDSTFTPATGIGVNLQLVAESTLLPSILSRVGPDVYLGAAHTQPVNFATRNALYDLTVFGDYPQVARRFHPSAIVPYTFNNQVFALPETQSFMMMFYRTDILDDLGLKPPRTWREFAEIITEFQVRNLTVGLPYSLNMYLTFLYQHGGVLYTSDGSRVLLDTPVAVDTFALYTDFYNLYRLPTDFDFANRFRSGEMPLGFWDYTLYNQFAIFAPEIRGLWAITNMPGTAYPDGNINNSIPATGSAAIIMKDSKDPLAAWEFIKWWTDSQTQANFGIGLQSIMGEAAMYPTANMEALTMLPWHPRYYRQIRAQWDHVVGIPEVPGGYYVTRSFSFAFNRLINTYRNQQINNVYDVVDPGDVLMRYIPAINAELSRKRKEFGLE
jgi:ABC-type glycerol-3-phosphate transport system substrate-binding protein